MKKRNHDKTKLLKDYCESHGHRPFSRRDFLAAGLISFSGMLTPSFSGLFSAYAEEPGNCGPTGPRMMPFVTLNLAGGAALAANFVPHDQGQQPLPSYDLLGLGKGNVPITREFGQVPFAGNGISQLITELRNAASPATLANTAFVAVCVRSQDDTANNKLDISGLVHKAGLVGERLPGLGKSQSTTGIRQMPAVVAPPAPLAINRLPDLEGALGVSGRLSRLKRDQKIGLFRLISRLSEAQQKKVLGENHGRDLAATFACGTDRNERLASAESTGVDVRQDANLARIWGVNGNSSSNDEAVVSGSMVLSALRGQAGSVSLEKGGYDYHNNTRTLGDQRDGEAGQRIGQILETAAALQQKVFLYVTTDGSCRSTRSDSPGAPWRSDNGSAGVNFMVIYDPQGRPETKNFQLGHFTSGQVADDNFITGGSPEVAASAVFANYLQVNGKLDQLDTLMPGAFSNEDLKHILMFG